MLRRKLALLSSGGLLLSILQSAGAIDFNNILFTFLAQLLSLLVSLLLGGNPLANGTTL